MKYFTKTEILLWSVSVTLIFTAFLIFDRVYFLTLIASLVGVTSLIFCAKGNPVGQALMIVFSMLYGIISLGFSYYDEMITYLGMTMPMAVVSLISWVKNPYNGNKSEVRVNKISRREMILALILTAAVTAVFYFKGIQHGEPDTGYIFRNNKLLCGISYFPEKSAVCCRICRQRLGFDHTPDLAAFSNISYLSVTVCFSAFFANDLYGFISWRRIEKRQQI